MCWPPASSPCCSWVTPLSTTGPPCFTTVSLAFCCDWTNPIHPHHHQLCGPSQHERSRLPKTEVCWTVQAWRLWKHVTATAQEKSISAQWGFLTAERQYAPRSFCSLCLFDEWNDGRFSSRRQTKALCADRALRLLSSYWFGTGDCHIAVPLTFHLQQTPQGHIKLYGPVTFKRVLNKWSAHHGRNKAHDFNFKQRDLEKCSLPMDFQQSTLVVRYKIRSLFFKAINQLHCKCTLWKWDIRLQLNFLSTRGKFTATF